MMSYIVYKITRSDGKEYVGTTTEKRLSIRMKQHASSERFKNHTFQYEVLFITDDEYQLYAAEEVYITIFDSYNRGLNVTKHGRGYNNTLKFTTRGYTFSLESRNKMRVAALGRKSWNKGKKCPQISAARIGRPQNQPKRKVPDHVMTEILVLYNSRPEILGVNCKAKNGKILTYERAFANKFCTSFNITNTHLHGLLKLYVSNQ